MLTHCLPMPGIIAKIRGISRNQFKCVYSKKQELFLKSLLHFQNLHKNLNVLKKKLSVIA